MALVLVVDDSRFSRNRAVAAVKQCGHEVVEATNGAEGLVAVEHQKPDCVFLDLLMPVMDGLEFLRVLRETDQRLPVIILSADIQTTSRSMCEDLGITMFLNKPFKPNEIEQCLAMAFGMTIQEANK